MGDIRALGYLTIDITDLDRWRTLAHDVLDLGVGADGDNDTLPTCASTSAPAASPCAAPRRTPAPGLRVHADAILDRIFHNTIWIDTGTHNLREHAAGNVRWPPSLQRLREPPGGWAPRRRRPYRFRVTTRRHARCPPRGRRVDERPARRGRR